MRVLALLPLAAAAGLAEPAVRVATPMRDGVKLAAHVFFPKPGGRWPVALLRTPYQKPKEITPALRPFLDRGYALVVQDVRGRYGSEGVFRPIVQEEADGEDTLHWIAGQPWCDGRIVMFGGSYSGMAAWRAALSGHPALKAFVAAIAGGDDYLDRYFSPGGAFRLAHRVSWIEENLRLRGFPSPRFDTLVRHLPLVTLDRAATGATLGFFQHALEHPFYDVYWQARSVRGRLERVKAPVLISGGWYDPAVDSDVEIWRALRARGLPARLIVGPWGHNMAQVMPNEDFGPDARPPLRRLELDWLDAWIKGSGAASAARCFLTGANRWEEAAGWPPATRRRVLYLSPEGRLTARRAPKAALALFIYDPRNPVPSLGGALCCNFTRQPWGPADQRPLDSRADVLRFLGEPLAADLLVEGRIDAELWIASDAPDTDFTAKLSDVAPGGVTRILRDGLLRLRYRQGLEQAAPYQPGQVEKVTIHLGLAAHQFRAGHRLRLDISSSNFPRFDRNPNTGRPAAAERELKPARQTVLLGGNRASRLVLPVVETRR